MILLPLLWLLITLSSLAVGAGIVALYPNATCNLKAPVLAWIGLATLSTVCSIWALFLPLGHFYGAGLFATSLLPLSSEKVRKIVLSGFEWPSLAWSAGALIAVVFLGGLLKASGPTEVFDDGIGYLVIFRALLDEGVIIGLGNLHPNLAYNSHWSILGAFYSFEWLTGRALYDLNGWLVWLGVWYAASFVPDLWAGRVRAIYLLLVATPFFYFRNQMSGNSTDLPIAILTWTVISEWILNKDRNHPAIGRWLFIILPLFAFSIKITGLSLLILPAGFILLQPTKERVKSLLFAAIASLFILGPWVARNILMTGYVYYLVPQLDLFSVDWKMPDAVLIRLKTQVATEINHQPKHLADPAWWRAWLMQGFNLQGRIILALSVLSMLVGAWAIVFRRHTWGANLVNPRHLTVCAFVGFGFLFWFFSATESRYGHSVLTIASLALISWLLARLSQKTTLPLGKVFAVFLTVGVAIGTVRTVREFNPPLRKVLLWPSPYPEVVWLDVPASNFMAYFPYRYVTPMNDQLRFPKKHTAALDPYPNCWCTPLPCVYKREDLPLLQQRGTDLRDGFRFIHAPKD